MGYQMRWLFKNPVVMLYMIIYSIGWGCLPVLGSSLVAMIQPFHYPAWQGSVVVIIVIISGLGSTILYSVFLLKKHNQNTYLLGVFTGSIMAFFVGLLIIRYNSIWCLVAVGFIFGFFSMNTIPICYDQVLRIVDTKMIPTVNCLFNIAAQVFTAVTTLYFGAI